MKSMRPRVVLRLHNEPNADPMLPDDKITMTLDDSLG